MEEGFGPYNFGFIEYTIKKIKVENHTLIIDGVNGLIMGKLYFIGLRDRYIPDEKRYLESEGKNWMMIITYSVFILMTVK